MSVTSPSARLTRLALLTLTGATALSVAACGASHTTSNTAQPSTAAGKTSSATSPSTPSAAPSGKAWVSGMNASVSGDAIQVTQQAGNATVDFTPSTKITEVTPAQLTDVTAGSCVAVHPTRDSADTGGAITAQVVRITPAVNGKCQEPKHPAGANGKNRAVSGTGGS